MAMLKLTEWIDKIRNIIPKNEIDDLVDADKKQSAAVTFSGIAIGVNIAVFLFSFHMFRNTVINENSPSYACPATYDMDSPVKLENVKSLSGEQFKMMVAGFIRRYIQAQYFRAPEDVEASIDFLLNHSVDGQRKRYLEYEDNVEEIKRHLMANERQRFYKKAGTNVRFPSSIGSRFDLEVDGYIIREKGPKEEFQIVTLRFRISRGDITEKNPIGLYVSADEVVIMKDPVSNEKKVEDGI